MNVRSKNRPMTIKDLIIENVDTSGLSELEIDEVASVAFSGLTPRSGRVLKARVEEGKTQAELGRYYGITTQRIREIYNKAEVVLLQRAEDHIKAIKEGSPSLYFLYLSPRLYNSLRRMNIGTIEDLENADFIELSERSGIGQGGMR